MIGSIVPKGADGMSVGRYLARAYPLIPAFVLRETLKKREVKLNGARAGAEDVLRSGDEVRLYIAEKYAPAPPKIVYADEDIISFVKPRGLPVDVDQDGIGEDTMLSRLKKIAPNVRLVHRLDTGTGGIMLAALNGGAEKRLTEAFSAHQVEKHYAALALGHMPQKRDVLRAHLEKDAGNARVRVTLKKSASSKPIETRYEMVREMNVKGITLSQLDVMIPTGRTHQIRAHLSFIDHPLLGDDKYGDRRANRALGITEPCLWCETLQIAGAKGLEKYEGMRFRAPRPEWKLEQ